MMDSIREIGQWVLIFALSVKVLLLERRLQRIESVRFDMKLTIHAEDAPRKAGQKTVKPN